MSRRVITVPKTKESESDLDYDRAKDEDLIELYITEEEYNILEREGIFKMINSLVGCIIDEYEDDNVTGKGNIYKVIVALKELPNKSVLADRVLELFEEAYKRETGVYFFF